jgi:formyl transferase-like protein
MTNTVVSAPRERDTLKVVALIVGDPQAMELWTLKSLAAVSGSLSVVRAQYGSGLSARKRLRGLVRQHGVRAVASRVIGNQLFGRLHERRQALLLERLFDGPFLREWWSASGIRPVTVPHLNHKEAHAAIAAVQPDILVRVSGGVLKRPTFGRARLGAINIHHGIAPRIRGMWSIPWGIVESRPDWIGATVHQIDDGIDTGRVFWRGSPQIAPGDTATTLFFRAHLEAVQALVSVIRTYERGETPPAWPIDDQPGTSVYRSAPGIGAWIRFLRMREGKQSDAILERALTC